MSRRMWYEITNSDWYKKRADKEKRCILVKIKDYEQEIFYTPHTHTHTQRW